MPPPARPTAPGAASTLPAIPGRAVFWLGLSQLVAWGVTYYLIGVFGERMAADLGWSSGWIYGGFSLAVAVMGLVSSTVGQRIDRFGGRPVMIAGTVVGAVGCLLLAASRHHAVWLLAWAVLGVAMRATLYDAAFATLARLGGAAARRPISQITLLGGLASTVFWPVGHALADAFGWRGALVAYAATLLATIPMLMTLPAIASPRARDSADASPPSARARARTPRELALAGALYAASTMLMNVLNAGLSAHTIAMLVGLGVGASAAVGYSALRGIGQSAARLLQVLFGHGIDPVWLNLGACALLPIGVAAGFAAGESPAAAIAFGIVFGAGNGIVSITRGTLPLVLFEVGDYGRISGRLLAPGFIAAAAAPLLFAFTIERFGARGGLWLSLGLSTAMAAAAAALAWRFGPARSLGPPPDASRRRDPDFP